MLPCDAPQDVHLDARRPLRASALVSLPSPSPSVTLALGYRLHVGLYARLLLRAHGRPIVSEWHRHREGGGPLLPRAEIAVVQLKLALPASKTRGFSHLDCDWQRGGCETPAPQCFVACSPQVVDGQKVFSARFVNVEEVVAREVERCTESRRPPYALPRTSKGACAGSATREPAGTDFHGRGRAGERLVFGDAAVWPPDGARVHSARDRRVSRGRRRGRTAWLRARRYPTLVAPWMHGVPHQSVEERRGRCSWVDRPGTGRTCTQATPSRAPPRSRRAPGASAAPSTPLAKLWSASTAHATVGCSSVVAADGRRPSQRWRPRSATPAAHAVRDGPGPAAAAPAAGELRHDGAPAAGGRQRCGVLALSAGDPGTVVRDAACAALADPELQSRADGEGQGRSE